MIKNLGDIDDFTKLITHLKQKNVHHYQQFSITGAVTNEKKSFSGNTILVLTGSLKVRFNDERNNSVVLTKGQWFKTPFHQVFITTTARTVFLLGFCLETSGESNVIGLGADSLTYALLACATANNAYGYTFPIGTKQILVKSRDGTAFKISKTVNGTPAVTDPYKTMPVNSIYGIDGIELKAALTLYFQFAVATKNIEIEYWDNLGDVGGGGHEGDMS